MQKENGYESSIGKALDKLNQTSSDEDARTKAIVKTKLQEAYLWAGKIYSPFPTGL